MDDTTKTLIEYASLGDPAWTRDDMLGIIAELAAALEAAHAEMHARELHHFETEKLLVEAGIDPDAAQRAPEGEAAHAEPDDDDRESLMRVLNQPEHAPMSDHDPRDGSCRSCPWPVYTLAPEDIAHAILAAGFSRGGTPATVEQVADVREVAEQIVERTKDQIATHSLDCHAYHLPCFAHFVLNRISTESRTGDDR